jgi:hypothetical protein
MRYQKPLQCRGFSFSGTDASACTRGTPMAHRNPHRRLQRFAGPQPTSIQMRHHSSRLRPAPGMRAAPGPETPPGGLAIPPAGARCPFSAPAALGRTRPAHTSPGQTSPRRRARADEVWADVSWCQTPELPRQAFRPLPRSGHRPAGASPGARHEPFVTVTWQGPAPGVGKPWKSRSSTAHRTPIRDVRHDIVRACGSP